MSELFSLENLQAGTLKGLKQSNKIMCLWWSLSSIKAKQQNHVPLVESFQH